VSYDRRRRTPGTRELSDLVGAELAIAAGIWIVVAIFSFVVVGPVAGIAAIIVGVIACGLVLAAEARQADIRD
jgi:hypothetical protein